MTDQTPATVVQDFHRAWTGGDIDRAVSHLAEDIVCHAPGGDIVGRDAYGRFLADFAPQLTGLVDLAAFADGERVALFYHPQTAATSTTVAAECFTVRDGRITEILLTFDRMSYAPPAPA